MADRNVRIDITAADKTRAGLESAKRGLTGLKNEIGTLTGVFSAFAGVAAAAGIAQMFNEAVLATQEFEKSSNRLDAVMKATGGTVGYTREQLEGMAVAMERGTIFSQNEMRDAMSVMTTFKSVQGDTFRQGIELAADMSAVMDQSLKSSVVQLGKALEDPVRGLSALREVGVSFTAQQEQMIKALAESGQKMQAQGIILEALEGQFGGTAGRMKDGIYGAVVATDQAWDRLLVTMGKTAPVRILVESSLLSVQTMLDGLNEALEKFNRGILDGPLGAGGKLNQPLDLPANQAITEMGTSEIKPQNRAEMEANRLRIKAETEAKRAAEAEARVKRQAELEKAADEEKKQRMTEATYLSNQYAKEQVDAIKAQEEAQRRELDAIKTTHEYRVGMMEMIDEVANDRTQAEAEAAARAEEEHKKELEWAMQKTQALVTSLSTEKELLTTWYDERFDMINNAEAMGLQVTGGWQAQRLRLVQHYEEQQTRAHDDAVKKRYGISQVYHRLDLAASQAFFGQIGGMMQSENRKMFEIGKAGAIGETIIQTYRAAQGAYAALAPIPFIGPALGVAAAAAAVVTGMARVQAIRSTSFGGGSGAVPTFAANPSTGLPTDFGPQTQELTPAQDIPAAAQPRTVNITLIGSGMVSTAWIRDELIPSINEASGDGVRIAVN